MRRLASALLLAANLLPGAGLADDIAWSGRGTIHLTVPGGWTLSSREAGAEGYYLRAQPGSGAAVVAQITLVALPADKPVRPDDVKGMLEKGVGPVLATSVEKALEPKPLSIGKASGWVVQLTDASLVGKPPVAGNFKVMRNAFAALDDHLMLVATIQFDDATKPEVAEAMALLSSLRVERSAGGGARPAAASAGAFDFTIPESRVVVKIPAIGLQRDAEPVSGFPAGPNYFKAYRNEPMLIVSGWLEPASRFAGLKAFWSSESKSPAYEGAGAPQHLEFLKVGSWEVIAFDIPVPGGGTSAHLRAERVQANTWIDLHLSSTSAKAAGALREELLATLRSIDVVEK